MQVSTVDRFVVSARTSFLPPAPATHFSLLRSHIARTLPVRDLTSHKRAFAFDIRHEHANTKPHLPSPSRLSNNPKNRSSTTMSATLPVVPYQCTGGPNQEVMATIIRKTSASLSVFGSAYVLITIWKKWRHKRSSIDPYQRIMAGMSIYDIIWSFFPWFMGSWLTPEDTGWWGARGNTDTCSLQGYFFWIGQPGAIVSSFSLLNQSIIQQLASL